MKGKVDALFKCTEFNGNNNSEFNVAFEFKSGRFNETH